jgi:GDP-L-fucose synthase
MTTLVTGSDGLLGTALKKFAKDDFYFANRNDADLTSMEQTVDLFKKVKPKNVIHLAAKVGGVQANLKFPSTFFHENMLINLNVLKSAQIYGVKKLVSYISTCVFPNTTKYPLSVLNLHSGEPSQSNFGYAYAKRMLEVQSRAYREEYSSNFITLVPTNMYGPGDNWNVDSGHVIPALIHKTFQAYRDKKILHAWGTGSPLREFTFSEDVAKISIWALKNYENPQPLIISNSIETRIRDLVEIIVKSMNFEGKVSWDSSKPNGQERKPSDSFPLNLLLPNFEFTPLTTGINFTVNWFEQNYESISRK